MKNTETPKVTIISPFRQNGSSYVDDYFDRAFRLDNQERLRWVLVEGDSTDDTWQRLVWHATRDNRVTLIKCDVNKPKYGSMVHPERFQILSQVFNAGLDAVDLDWTDYAVFIPSDVIYKPDTLTRLIAQDKDLIAPMFWVGDHAGDPVANANGLRFYDLWGFRRNGQGFLPVGPAWYRANLPDEPIEMETIGGVILMRAAVLKAGCRYTPEAVDHGLCEMAQAAGFSVWCDPTTHVLHG